MEVYLAKVIKRKKLTWKKILKRRQIILPTVKSTYQQTTRVERNWGGGGGTCFSTYILILNSDVYLREKVFELFEARSKINTPTKEPPFTITPLPTMVKKIVSVRKVEKYFLVTWYILKASFLETCRTNLKELFNFSRTKIFRTYF